MSENKEPKLSSGSLANRVIHGDNLEVMPRIPTGSIDLVLTDPPYVVRYRPRDGRTIRGDTSTAWIEPTFEEIYRVLKWDSFCVSFYGWHRPEAFFNAWQSAGFLCIGHLVWVKPYDCGKRFLRYRHESAMLLAKGYPKPPKDPIMDVQPWKYTGNKRHPNQKAVSILRPLVGAFSQPGELVLDPFCGSGSTLVAAAQMGRRFIGIELDGRWSQDAEKRLANIPTGR
jgi:site-specific DNA-methyltransferase (adenine-specific)